MPKFAKRFLIGAIAALVVFALILLCINVYLQSGAVQQRIRNSAAQYLGPDLKIRSTTYFPWQGLVLRDISIPDPLDPNLTIVKAAALRVRFALFPLLQQRFVITECSLFEPSLVIRQLDSGDWVIPFPPTELPESPEGTQTSAGPRVKGPSFKAEINRFRMGGVNVVFLDAKKRIVLKMEKSDLDAQIAPDLTAKGVFDIGRMEVANSLKPRRIGGPFTWDGKVLDVPAITGGLAGGKLTAAFRLDSGPTPQFSLTSQLDGVLLKKLADDARVDPGKTDGQLRGTLNLTGDPRTTQSLKGNGHFELIEATLKPIEILSKLGELFQIDELQLLQLSDAKIDLTIADERVNIDQLLLRSENLIIDGTGPVRFNGKLDIDARLLVNKKLQRQLKGILSRNFVESEIPDYKKLEFNVTGRIDNPESDLLDKITGIKLGKDLGGFLNNIFGGSSQKKDNKKKDDKKDKQ